MRQKRFFLALAAAFVVAACGEATGPTVGELDVGGLCQAVATDGEETQWSWCEKQRADYAVSW